MHHFTFWTWILLDSKEHDFIRIWKSETVNKCLLIYENLEWIDQQVFGYMVGILNEKVMINIYQQKNSIFQIQS